MRRSVLLLWVLLCPFAQAQDVADLFGTWSATASGPSGDPNCGDAHVTGEIRVLQRASHEDVVLYQGVMTSETTYSNCDGVRTSSSEAQLVVNDDKVEIYYTNPEWFPDYLVRAGDTMTGPDSAGLVGHWVKTSGPDDASRAAEVKAAMAQSSYEESASAIRESMLSQGLDPAVSESTLWQFFDGMAACEVDALMTSSAEQSLSFYELVNMIDPLSGGISNMDIYDSFDRKSFNARSSACMSGLKKSLDKQMTDRVENEN